MTWGKAAFTIYHRRMVSFETLSQHPATYSPDFHTVVNPCAICDMEQTLHTSRTTAVERSRDTLLFAIANRPMQMSLLLCDSVFQFTSYRPTTSNRLTQSETIISQRKKRT
jgi:hypothetical protein